MTKIALSSTFRHVSQRSLRSETGYACPTDLFAKDVSAGLVVTRLTGVGSTSELLPDGLTEGGQDRSKHRGIS
jgi:hypothetical protein